MTRKTETYYLMKSDLIDIEVGNQVEILTKDGRIIILKRCECEDCKDYWD